MRDEEKQESEARSQNEEAAEIPRVHTGRENIFSALIQRLRLRLATRYHLSLLRSWLEWLSTRRLEGRAI